MSAERVEIGNATLWHGDCLAAMAELCREGVIVDAVVTDPPYGLEFMGKDWDSFRTNGGSEWSQRWQTGKDWKGQERLRPGRLYMRSSHQTCRKCGKQSHQHDSARCAPEYELIVHKSLQTGYFQAWSERWARAAYEILRPGGFLLAFGGTRTAHRMFCAIEDAGFVIQDTIAWVYGSGFPKGKALLKPAFEPICAAYKPGGKRMLQIDECRIEGSWKRDSETRCDIRGGRFVQGVTGGLPCEPQSSHPAGRWPANLCHDGSDEVMAAFAKFRAPGQSGIVTGHEPSPTTRNVLGLYGARASAIPHGDAGSAARFFYCAKASKEERAGSRHPTVKPLALMRWLVALVTPPGGTVLDPFAGSGTTGVAAIETGRNAILIEREAEYIADIRRRLQAAQRQGRLQIEAAMPPRHRTTTIEGVGDLLAALA